MEGLAPIDTWAVAAVLAKAMEYAAALLAIGGPLFVVTFREAPVDVLRIARTIAIGAALLGLTLLALRFGIRSARISGMGAEGMTDRLMLGLVWDSPLGSAALWRGTGALLVLALAFDGAIACVVGLLGSVLIVVSYTLVGHVLGEPRWLLAGLLSVHLLGVGFWVAALAPLYRAADKENGVALLHRFGVLASVTVSVLVLAGLSFAGLMAGSLTGLFGTAYGWILMLKVAFFAGLLGLAALNKLRLVPALAAGDAAAATRLRYAIRFEAVAILGVLLATATLTSVTTPPVNM